MFRVFDSNCLINGDTSIQPVLAIILSLYSTLGTILATSDRLLTCNVDGVLQLWTVDNTSSPPAVVLDHTMEVDGPVFSASFDNKLDLVKFHTTLEYMSDKNLENIDMCACTCENTLSMDLWWFLFSSKR